MQSKLKFCLAALALFALTACGTLPGNSAAGMHYAATQRITLEGVLPLPPEVGSPEGQKDMAAVLAAQKTRSPAQVAAAQRDAEISIFRFRSVLGKKFTPENLPVTVALFRNVMQDEEPIIMQVKQYYNRPRPYVANDQVRPVVEHPPNASYPSGHSAFAYTTALILAEALPEKKTQIFNRAAAYAHNRVVAGVHYPTDILAGHASASVIVDALMNDPKFKADFKQSRRELRRVLLNK
jgi:acid phosphatase (class A)